MHDSTHQVTENAFYMKKKPETLVIESILAFVNFIIELIVNNVSKLFWGEKPKSTNICVNHYKIF